MDDGRRVRLVAPGRELTDTMDAVRRYDQTTRELPGAVKHTHRALVTLMLAALYGTGIRPGDISRRIFDTRPFGAMKLAGEVLGRASLDPTAAGITLSAIWARRRWNRVTAIR